ncbi:lmo0937 family membrane protein [Patescibacteria group bacterium]|nr:lmo0937 family membrane protein [Patescibacteria group bacterium]
MAILIAVLSAVMWIIGVALSYSSGGFIHLLLVISVIALTYYFLNGSKTDQTHLSGY